MSYPYALIEDLKKLHGIKPYNTPTNFLYLDPYFAKSIINEWGECLVKEVEKSILNGKWNIRDIMLLKKGTKIHVHLDTGFAGSEERSNYILSRDYDETELLNILHQMALDNAQSYGIEDANELTDEELEEAQEDGVEVSWDISGWYDIYDEEKHSGYVYTGHPKFEEF